MQTLNGHQQQQQQEVHVVQVTNVTQSVIVVQPPVKPVSKLAGSFWLKGSQLFGGLTTLTGILCVCGALTESIYLGQETEVSSEVYSANDYSGYWCGFLIISASIIPTLVGLCHIDGMIISNLLGSLVAAVFASILIALTADLFQNSNLDTVLLAAYGLMVGAASFTLLVTMANAVICLKAIICRNRRVESNVINVQTAPVQQQQQQQQ